MGNGVPSGTSGEWIGAVRHPDRTVRLNADRPRRTLSVTNTSKRPVRISSHYPFWRTNPSLEFDREAALGYRLDIPAGTSVRWDPGGTRVVELVAYGGRGGAEAAGGR